MPVEHTSLSKFLVAAAMTGLLTACGGAGAQSSAPPRETVVGGPCEGCEAVFDGLPTAPSHESRIAPAEEPGERLRIEGVVRDGEGRVAAGVVVYAYHTDAGGIYPPDSQASTTYGRRHGRLRAWARTDDLGRYAFDTIRPGSYPDTSIPAHVHMHVIEPGRCTYYIDDIHFTDDPLLVPAARQNTDRARGGSGIATPHRGDDGTWRVVRDVVLGANVPGYPGAPSR